MDPIEQMRQQVCEELHGSVTIVGKFLLYMGVKAVILFTWFGILRVHFPHLHQRYKLKFPNY